jgi:DNA-binding protein HU-beta
MTKYKKSDLIEHLAQKVSLSKKQAEDIVESVLDYITDVLKKGDELTFTGFGSFSAKMRKGRMGINPKNPSQSVNIPPSVVPRFKAGKALKDVLNKK